MYATALREMLWHTASQLSHTQISCPLACPKPAVQSPSDSTPLLHNVGHIALQAPRADGRFTVSTTTLVSYLRASALQPPDSVPSWSTFPSLSPRCISRCTFCREASSSPGTFALVYWPLGVQPVHSLGVPSRCIFRVYVSEQAPVPTRCTLLVQFPSVPFAFALGS